MIKKIIYNLLIVIALVYILDLGIGKLLQYFYFQQSSGFQYRTSFAIEKTKADILVFGSSRANHHYSPTVFEKRYNYSYYNVGRDGVPIFYHYALLKTVLNRYRPKLVILDFSRGEFDKNQYSYDRLSALLPYYSKHPEIRNIIKLRSPYENLKLISNIYPYNSSILSIAIGNLEFNKRRWEDNKGYVPLSKAMEGTVSKDTAEWTKELDSLKVNIYESFIRDCVKSNIKLFIICSPYYIKFAKNDESIVIGKNIAKQYGIEFLDFSNSTTFSNKPHLFADKDHLNDNGAITFSKIILDSIKNP